jgi:hypothetical protein
MTMTKFAACTVLSAVLLGSALTACGSSERPRIHTETDAPETWVKRSLWTEKSGEKTLVMVVGRAGNASLDQSMAIDNAEQDARERMALYLAGTVQAFRERLATLASIKGKRGEVGDGSVPGVAAELTSKDVRGGRALADTAVRGLEIVNSVTDKTADTLLVLGQLDFDRFRGILARATVLTVTERQLINENTEEVRRAMDQALQEAQKQMQ